MAARNFVHPLALQRSMVLLAGGGTGAGAADLTGVVGVGFAATAPFDQTGTGLYTITLADKHNALLFLSGTVIDATTPDDWEVVVVSETVATDKKINIAVFKGGALADLSTDEKLRVLIVLSNTAQVPD